MNPPRAHSLRPSLRRRLLLVLLVPVGVLLLLDAMLTYGVALTYANRVHDRDLSDDALTLATMLGNDQLDGELTPQARFLLEYDPDGHSYFTVSSARHGLLASNGQLPQPAQVPAIGARPALYDAQLAKHALRAATVHIAMRSDPGDSLVVTVAETLRDRHQQAREILLLASVTQALLIAGVLSLVWFGVGRGLRVLDPLTARLAARTHELTPIDGPDVPQEIQPLTHTIDALFGRLRSMLALHDRFIADAAHQLRTPLTGLSLHVEHAMADPRPETVADALVHIRRLTQRAARTSAQLLALTRAQAPSLEAGERTLLDLSRFIPEAVSERVHEAIRAGVDLGYEGTGQALSVLGDAASVQDLLDNLIDNAVRYAGRGSTVTVKLQARADGGASLSVEDNGPGVPSELLPRLSERFFRAAGSNEEGSGLGLAIVQRIAERHHAEVIYRLGEVRGLCVEVRFPAPPSPAGHFPSQGKERFHHDNDAG
jgi:two-component system, OmpR family, sensor histidine kinase TctE